MWRCPLPWHSQSRPRPCALPGQAWQLELASKLLPATPRPLDPLAGPTSPAPSRPLLRGLDAGPPGLSRYVASFRGYINQENAVEVHEIGAPCPPPPPLPPQPRHTHVVAHAPAVALGVSGVGMRERTVQCVAYMQAGRCCRPAWRWAQEGRPLHPSCQPAALSALRILPPHTPLAASL